ncbi:unnamed protein product [Cyprideis torosa]|uniref:Aldehyde dehydrogenase domain-containing protein n=1 Tax=Cyprideis torosa TaxID=163714 RepID=A0A7R8ZJT7_9CRUS|nr:unnamed protein product [Cyprideis torosa]CAG0880339.1 unnamed protein product [Cyprideis torosa]
MSPTMSKEAVSKIFDTMEYGTVFESVENGKIWINTRLAQGHLGHFINGSYASEGGTAMKQSFLKTDVFILDGSMDHLETAVGKAASIQQSWKSTAVIDKGRILYSLPAGLLNVIHGSDSNLSEYLANSASVGGLIVLDDFEGASHMRSVSASFPRPLMLRVQGGSLSILVFGSSDFESAIDGVIDCILQDPNAAARVPLRVLVELPLFDDFLQQLKEKLKTLRTGDFLDKLSDCWYNPSDKQKAAEYAALIEECRQEAADIFQLSAPVGAGDYCAPLTLLSNVGTSSRLWNGPCSFSLVLALPFRSTKEGVALVNNSVYGEAASIWTENITKAMEVARHLKASVRDTDRTRAWYTRTFPVGSVFVNSSPSIDPSLPFSGWKLSGNATVGGSEGLINFLKPACKVTLAPWLPGTLSELDDKLGLSENPESLEISCVELASSDSLDRTYKLWIGGKQVRPASGSSRPLSLRKEKKHDVVPIANRKDVRQSVEAAQQGFSNWYGKTAFNRSQILFYWAENLSTRESDFSQVFGGDRGIFNQTLEDLFRMATWADRVRGTVKQVPLKGQVTCTQEPLGVVVILPPADNANFGLRMIAAALAAGNSVIVVAPQADPFPYLQMIQIWETSDFPAGCINVLTGSDVHLLRHLTLHQDVQGVWCFSSKECCSLTQRLSAHNLKLTWCCPDVDPSNVTDRRIELNATRSKCIWIPCGDIFAN